MIDTLKYVIYISSLFSKPTYHTVVAISNDYISFHDGVTYRHEKIIDHVNSVYVYDGGYVHFMTNQVEIKSFGKSQPIFYRIRRREDRTRKL